MVLNQTASSDMIRSNAQNVSVKAKAIMDGALVRCSALLISSPPSLSCRTLILKKRRASQIQKPK